MFGFTDLLLVTFEHAYACCMASNQIIKPQIETLI